MNPSQIGAQPHAMERYHSAPAPGQAASGSGSTFGTVSTAQPSAISGSVQQLMGRLKSEITASITHLAAVEPTRLSLDQQIAAAENQMKQLQQTLDALRNQKQVLEQHIAVTNASAQSKGLLYKELAAMVSQTAHQQPLTTIQEQAQETTADDWASLMGEGRALSHDPLLGADQLIFSEKDLLELGKDLEEDPVFAVRPPAPH